MFDYHGWMRWSGYGGSALESNLYERLLSPSAVLSPKKTGPRVLESADKSSVQQGVERTPQPLPLAISSPDAFGFGGTSVSESVLLNIATEAAPGVISPAQAFISKLRETDREGIAQDVTDVLEQERAQFCPSWLQLVTTLGIYINVKNIIGIVSFIEMIYQYIWRQPPQSTPAIAGLLAVESLAILLIVLANNPYNTKPMQDSLAAHGFTISHKPDKLKLRFDFLNTSYNRYFAMIVFTGLFAAAQMVLSREPTFYVKEGSALMWLIDSLIGLSYLFPGMIRTHNGLSIYEFIFSGKKPASLPEGTKSLIGPCLLAILVSLPYSYPIGALILDSILRDLGKNDLGVWGCFILANLIGQVFSIPQIGVTTLEFHKIGRDIANAGCSRALAKHFSACGDNRGVSASRDAQKLEDVESSSDNGSVSSDGSKAGSKGSARSVDGDVCLQPVVRRYGPQPLKRWTRYDYYALGAAVFTMGLPTYALAVNQFEKSGIGIGPARFFAIIAAVKCLSQGRPMIKHFKRGWQGLYDAFIPPAKGLLSYEKKMILKLLDEWEVGNTLRGKDPVTTPGVTPLKDIIQDRYEHFLVMAAIAKIRGLHKDNYCTWTSYKTRNDEVKLFEAISEKEVNALDLFSRGFFDRGKGDIIRDIRHALGVKSQQAARASVTATATPWAAVPGSHAASSERTPLKATFSACAAINTPAG